LDQERFLLPGCPRYRRRRRGKGRCGRDAHP
jgi:hypothetical protein